jgi:hypothetical protein
MIKKIILLLFSILLGSIFVGLYYISKQNTINTLPNIPTTQFSIDKAPKASLQGTISQISGTVLWQSRAEDQPLPVTTIPELQQGEKIATQNDGKVTIQFGKTIVITASSNTVLNFIQTLPVDIVIAQNGESATYENSGNTFPISVRTAGLLTNLTQGKIIVAFDKNTSLVIIKVLQGSSEAAWNDGDNNTHLVTIEQGKQFEFNTDTEITNLVPMQQQ